MKPLVMFPDAERAMVNLLTTLLGVYEPGYTVGVGVPDGWSPGSSYPHLQVAWDGTPLQAYPVVQHATIRLVAWAYDTTEAKRLASLAEGLALAYEGDAEISGIRPLTGVLPAQDPDTRAEIASVTVRVTVRSEPVLAS